MLNMKCLPRSNAKIRKKNPIPYEIQIFHWRIEIDHWYSYHLIIFQGSIVKGYSGWGLWWVDLPGVVFIGGGVYLGWRLSWMTFILDDVYLGWRLSWMAFIGDGVYRGWPLS